MEKALLLFMVKHLASGAAGGVSFGLGILTLDVGNLRSLLQASEHWMVGGFMLFFGLVITFAGIALATGIMSLGEARDDRE